MKITLNPTFDARNQDSITSNALRAWYDARPAIRRLWAIGSEHSGDPRAPRVIVMLEPSHDGNETSPSWMAHSERWALELREQLAGAVDLERIDGPLPDEFELEGEGVVLSAMSWRDSTLLQD